MLYGLYARVLAYSGFVNFRDGSERIREKST